MMHQINSLFSAWKAAYLQQGPAGRVLIPALFLLVFCCLCAVTINVFRPRSSANPPPSPGAFPTVEGQPTPTALFDFDFPTFTPFPTLPPPSPFPTLTPLPTETQTSTPIAPAATLTPIPSATTTATPVPPTPTVTATRGPVVILAVHKVAENVDIQNISPAAVDLDGWRLVSEAGDQSCELRGRLAPNAVLKIWANRGPGFDCRLPNEIWLDNEADPAVLYNPQGQEVSRFP